MFIVFGLLYWVGMARLIRGQILSLREQEYVLSAQATGAKAWIIRKHLLPNCISVVIISTALQIPNAFSPKASCPSWGWASTRRCLRWARWLLTPQRHLFLPLRLIIPAVVICLTC